MTSSLKSRGKEVIHKTRRQGRLIIKAISKVRKWATSSLRPGVGGNVVGKSMPAEKMEADHQDISKGRGSQYLEGALVEGWPIRVLSY